MMFQKIASNRGSIVAGICGKSTLRKSLSSLSAPEKKNHGRRNLESTNNNSGYIDPCSLDISYPAYMIWGSNTGVGKTLVSAGLSSSIFSQKCPPESPKDFKQKDVLYLKPVQTGFPRDSDSRFVANIVPKILRKREQTGSSGLFVSNHTLQASPAVRESVWRGNSLDSNLSINLSKDGTGMKDLCSYKDCYWQGCEGEDDLATNYLKAESLATPAGLGSQPALATAPAFSTLTCKTMWAWFNPVSPHLAACTEMSTVGDSVLLSSLISSLGAFSHEGYSKFSCKDPIRQSEEFEKWAIVETAGGVASPGPSGTLQGDLYRQLRMPGILVGDGKLGGISSTISSFESLHLRGYDIEAVVLLDSGLSNETPLREYFADRVPVLVLAALPLDSNEELAKWFTESKEVFSELQSFLEQAHLKRISRLQEMPSKAGKILWWPFTQHSIVTEGNVTVIDSRYGESFSIHKGRSANQREALVQQFDACASWWTQGPNTKLQQELAREVAYATGRYGHVMFPENVYEPALHCAELLLQGVGKGWASRVYYSDNGSTAIEIALKMAFRKFSFDHGLLSFSRTNHHAERKETPELKVLALKGSYHGDTLGAMDAQAPSPFTGFLQHPWYSGRGFFLEAPTIFLQNRKWRLKSLNDTQEAKCGKDETFQSKNEIFCMQRDSSIMGEQYRSYIRTQISSFRTKGSGIIAALIIEPVVHAAAGMQMVDPLFQRVLVRECQDLEIPVIFDEVFAGCWRLGAESAAEILGCLPDIACYAKLLTGGTIPLAVTLATEAVFETFKGSSKLDALLHGHSYSAHAMGCSAAIASLKFFRDPVQNCNLQQGRLKELWSTDIVEQISSHPSVKRVIALGTLFACELQPTATESGYASTLTKGIMKSLRADGVYSRPLGNVVYLMCSPLTKSDTCKSLLQTLLFHLDSIE